MNDIWWLVNDDEHDNNDEVTRTFIIMMQKNMTTVNLTRCFHPSHKIEVWKACITQYGSLWNPSQSVQPKSKSKVSRPNLSFQIQGHFPIFGFLPQPHGLVTVEDVAPLTCCIQTSMSQSNTFRSWVPLQLLFQSLDLLQQLCLLIQRKGVPCGLATVVKLSDVA